MTETTGSRSVVKAEREPPVREEEACVLGREDERERDVVSGEEARRRAFA